MPCRRFSYKPPRHQATLIEQACVTLKPGCLLHRIFCAITFLTFNNMSLITYLVEDSKTIRENLISTLEELCTVKVIGYAETEEDAASWLSSHKDDWKLAIVDLFLKEGSGLGVLQGCQSRSADQKVVVLTNYATADIRQRCAALGCDAVFDKSNELDELFEYCRAVTLSQTVTALNGDASKLVNVPPGGQQGLHLGSAKSVVH